MELETTNSRRDWWLVKVPNYMGKAFADLECGTNLGKLKVTRTPKGQEVHFDIADDIKIGGKRPSEEELPRPHKLILHQAARNQLAVLSETITSQEAAAKTKVAGNIQQPDHVSIEGRIVQRADARPASTASYMALKRREVALSQKPKRPVKQISGPVPRKAAETVMTIEPTRAVKDRRVRLSKEEVEEKLFNLFERHQYYNFNDLVRLTEQPPTHLKEVLKGIAVYNTKNPHRNMWQLNAELQRYDADKDKST